MTVVDLIGDNYMETSLKHPKEEQRQRKLQKILHIHTANLSTYFQIRFQTIKRRDSTMGITHPHMTKSSRGDDGYGYSVTFEPQYFAEGVSRYAFRGEIQSKGPANGKKVVVKVFKKEIAKKLSHWTADFSASKKAQAYARKFNEVVRQKNIQAAEISFKIPIILQVKELSKFYWFFLFPGADDQRFVLQGEYVALEDFIPGNYQKFNSNGGYEDESISKLLLTFCHWTWEVSGHNFMICDLQGVKSANGYYLTDPAVHSKEQLYGPTDLGLVGMEMVLKGHRCNDFCRILGLQNPMHSLYKRGPRHKTYRFTLTEEEKLRNRKKRPNLFRFTRPLLTIPE